MIKHATPDLPPPATKRRWLEIADLRIENERLRIENERLEAALEDGVNTLEAMNLHDTPLYERMREALEAALARKEG